MKSALKTIYLDNSATTRAYRESAELAADVMYNFYGNPSSLHRKGIEAEKIIKKAKEQIADTIKASPSEIYFTSGGTEADNLAIIGGCSASRGKHIISTNVEHPAVLSTLQHLEKKGYSVDRVQVAKNGCIDLDHFARLLRKDTALVSCMYVNNEIGSIEPVDKIKKVLKAANSTAVLHIDAVQAYGKIPLNAPELDANFISLSSHKIHGPKGVGALYIKNNSKISPITFGGGQQNGIRPGTENVPGIAAFGLAAEICHTDMVKKVERMEYLKNRLKKGILTRIDDIYINTPEMGAAPHILNVSFAYVKAEVLLHSLENDGIYVSSGSACSSHKKGPSYVLTAIGTERRMIDGSIRFSLSEFTTEEEIDFTIERLTENVKKIRRLMKK
ncbi:MAG: cysteine desulfurase [Clostridia bacterium]|nr:cysteine desulfurase [Clostridia bacterium]